MSGPLKDLARRLGHEFRRPALLSEALTHTSALSSRRGGVSYERLEFLGDRVLALVAAELLLARFPEEREGEISRRHVALVRRETLADVAADLDLGDYLIVSRGEAEAGGRDNPAILADACEAVIAALYLDGGLEAARRFIERALEPHVVAAVRPPRDAKTALQEWAQARSLPLPEYREVDREGPDHESIFLIEVSVEGHSPTRARGSAKRTAEQAAASDLLLALGEDEW